MRPTPHLLGFPAFLAPSALLAADSASVQTSTAGALLQTFLALVVVLGILYAFLWLLRRYAPSQTGTQGVVKVVGGVMLGPREKVVVVEVGETWLLVGVAPGQVSALHTLPKPEGYIVSPTASPQAPFAGKLGELLARRKN
ncbi:flagellar protein FliO/FliZ [Sulfuritortus calidifontis]|uniref:Flagellar protein n=1 Tax=Sulfuritortus calidifontis TaxID=1914471 RepID=A0A4R3K0T2_9PROT|nr:flagellar biosynthetic protein FliO [Sulfuritortus calidifontis]TCS73962.1 flagellar protein FliO/FliZ [Sulfuritortus calidifontis]